MMVNGSRCTVSPAIFLWEPLPFRESQLCPNITLPCWQVHLLAEGVSAAARRLEDRLQSTFYGVYNILFSLHAPRLWPKVLGACPHRALSCPPKAAARSGQAMQVYRISARRPKRASTPAGITPQETATRHVVRCTRSAPVAEGARPHEPLSGGAEAAARGGHNVAPLQDLSKHIPGGLAREADPDVGGVLSAVHGEAQVHEGLAQDGCILSVE